MALAARELRTEQREGKKGTFPSCLSHIGRTLRRGGASEVEEGRLYGADQEEIRSPEQTKSFWKLGNPWGARETAQENFSVG